MKMAIKKEYYKAIEDLVGPENISDDPIHLDAWAWRSGQVAHAFDFRPRFEAIVMPQSTAEVQAIVKLCNRYKIQFKASSTGWGVYCDPTGPGCIKLDLRRMNRILEINEHSMYAVVEPYVISGQLQAELMKRGLYTNINGAGANSSAFPLAAHEGIGHSSQNCSFGDRNVLAVEWVTPEGEIVKFGSAGALGEWFCGDGPGPSLRGVIRGNVMPLGGLGVFTTAATKCYHWPGPANGYAVEGISPRYTMKEMPANSAMKYLSFPTEDGRTLAVQKIGESEIGHILMGFSLEMIAANIGTSNEEELELTKKFSKEIVGPGFVLGIIGNSARDFDYKMRVLEIIIKESKATLLKAIEDPKIQSGLLWRCVRPTCSIRETMRATGAFAGEVFGTDNYPTQTNFIQHSIKDKQSLFDRDLILKDSNIPFTTSIEHGHLGHSEVLIRYTPGPDIMPYLGEYQGKSNAFALKGHYGLPHHVFGDPQHEMFGPVMFNYHLWLRKVKKSFDPNNASEASNFITVKE
jgi:glycolate oxidase